MKNTIIKKAFACMTSLMAVSALSASMASYAVDTPTINESPANVITPANTANIEINKDIVLFNVDGSQILSPNITYSYEVKEASIDATNPAKITTYSPSDFENGVLKEGAVPTVVTVKKGVIGAISTNADVESTADEKEATISFGAADDTHTNDNTTKHATNTEKGDNEEVDLTKKVRNSMTITVDANKIYDPEYGKEGHTNAQVNGPGVYRYKIEDVTTPETLAASGIERKYKDTTDNHDKYVYLDVYTKYNANQDGLVIYGYVLLKDAQGNDNVDITYKKETQDETLKVTGFDTESENKDEYNEQTCIKGDLTSDAYHTYNVEVSKKTDGDLADTQNNFPFKVELTNANVTSSDDFYYEITKDGQAINARDTSLGTGKLADTEFGVALDASGAWTLDGISDESTNLQLQNGDKILITGLPVNTKIKVTEKNNTADKYTVSAKLNNVALSSPTGQVDAGANAAMGGVASISQTTGKDTIEFTNTLKDISVTGLLFNIAPFIFITLAGVVLISIFMRNKKNDNADNVI